MVVATCAEAYARTEVSHKGGVDAPQRTVQRTDDGITVAYTFTGNVPSACNAGDGGCVWRIEGFGLRDAPGGYATPFRVDAFAVPEGCTAVVEVVDSAFADYGCLLAPARRIPEKGVAPEGVVGQGGELAAQDGFMSRRVVAAARREAVYRGQAICNVVVNPVQYDAAARTARAYTRITYRVRFVPKAGARAAGDVPAAKPEILPSDNLPGNVTLNWASAKGGGMAAREARPGADDDTRDYLIISVDKYAEAVDRFAAWKEMLGFRVHKVLKDGWSSDEVKAEVAKAYAANPALYYLLIVGDHDDVPGQYMEHHADDGDFSVHYTDLYYGCMDGEGDETPDIYRGRLSVSSPEEAATVVDKIIGYEKTPPTDAGFYERGVNCADYLDNDNGVADDYEDRRYVQTAEEIRAYMLGQGKDVERVYSTNYEITPKYWNRNYFSFGEPIPEDMLKPAFAWDGNEGDIRRAINSGVFYVLHRDHGLVDCWENPYFSVKHVDILQNGDLLPVVFCVNCDNGAFQADCLAERFLRKQGGGAVAVIAASDISYSGYNDALACGLFDAIWPVPGLRPKFPGVNSLGGETPAPTYELGQILDQAQVRVSETFGSSDPSVSSNEKNDSFCRIVTKEIYHCFGDPSMQIRTEMPAPFSGVSVTRGNGCVTVGNGGETARITFVNRRTGEVVSHIAPSAVYTTADFEDVDVCVSGHNRIPYIDAGKLTGIESVQTDKAAADGDEPMYDLSGIRLYKEPQKGIYIKGHKKTVAGER